MLACIPCFNSIVSDKVGHTEPRVCVTRGTQKSWTEEQLNIFGSDVYFFTALFVRYLPHRIVSQATHNPLQNRTFLGKKY